MATILIIVHSFSQYSAGDIVSDGAEIQNITRSEHSNRTVKVIVPDSNGDQN